MRIHVTNITNSIRCYMSCILSRITASQFWYDNVNFLYDNGVEFRGMIALNLVIFPTVLGSYNSKSFISGFEAYYRPKRAYLSNLSIYLLRILTSHVNSTT